MSLRGRVDHRTVNSTWAKSEPIGLRKSTAYSCRSIAFYGEERVPSGLDDPRYPAKLLNANLQLLQLPAMLSNHQGITGERLCDPLDR